MPSPVLECKTMDHVAVVRLCDFLWFCFLSGTLVSVLEATEIRHTCVHSLVSLFKDNLIENNGKELRGC